MKQLTSYMYICSVGGIFGERAVQGKRGICSDLKEGLDIPGEAYLDIVMLEYSIRNMLKERTIFCLYIPLHAVVVGILIS